MGSAPADLLGESAWCQLCPLPVMGGWGALGRPRPACTPALAPQAQPWSAPGSLPRLQLIEQQWHEGRSLCVTRGPREGRAAAGFLLSRDELVPFPSSRGWGGFGLALKRTWLVGRTGTRTEVGNRVARPDRTAPPAASAPCRWPRGTSRPQSVRVPGTVTPAQMSGFVRRHHIHQNCLFPSDSTRMTAFPLNFRGNWSRLLIVFWRNCFFKAKKGFSAVADETAPVCDL